MLALFNLLPTCDETNRAAGLSGWWSRREQPVQREFEFEGGNYRQFLCGRVFDLCALEEFPGIPRKCRPEVNGFLWDIGNGIKTTLNKSHVSLVSRLVLLHTNRSWLRGAMNVLRGVVRDMGCMWDGCAELWCVVCGG